MLDGMSERMEKSEGGMRLSSGRRCRRRRLLRSAIKGVVSEYSS